MLRNPVASSNVKDVGYDPASRLLEVGFRNGSVYQYRDVPDIVAAELTGAVSVGTYLHRNVKYRYAYRRVA